MRVCKQGWPFVALFIVIALIFAGVGHLTEAAWMAWAAGVSVCLAAYCAYFFRDPPREIPRGDQWVLSPADGKILAVVQENGSWLVRIFLSVFDPHLQRAPISGEIQAIRYKKGKFLDARDPRAHFENEQNRLDIAGRAGAFPVTVIQIAGLIARRIVCWAREGQSLTPGERFGLIRFGSQVDIMFPASAQLRVKAGDRVKAGESILAEIIP